MRLLFAAPLFALALLAAAAGPVSAGPNAICQWQPACVGPDLNLGGTTIEKTTTASAQECCDKCASMPDYKCKGYNWCSADYCEGGSPKGQCDLKDFDTSKPGEIWGCSGAGQLWKSGTMSSTIKLGDIPPPCNAPPGVGPSGFDGCSTCLRENWGGKLVVLDVDSWKMGEGGNHGSPYVRSAYACSYSCNNYQGGAGSEGLTANAFTFCDNPKGCGENCADFTRGKAPLDGSQDRLFFGPFATAPKSVCTPDNKFPYQMCSCKKVYGGRGDPSADWVSGFTVERPVGRK